MLEFSHYFNRSLVGFILLAVVAITILTVLVPIIVDTIEDARTLSDAISSGAILTN